MRTTQTLDSFIEYLLDHVISYDCRIYLVSKLERGAKLLCVYSDRRTTELSIPTLFSLVAYSDQYPANFVVKVLYVSEHQLEMIRKGEVAPPEGWALSQAIPITEVV